MYVEDSWQAVVVVKCAANNKKFPIEEFLFYIYFVLCVDAISFLYGHSADHVLLGQRANKVRLPDGGRLAPYFVIVVAVQLQLAHKGNLQRWTEWNVIEYSRPRQNCQLHMTN